MKPYFFLQSGDTYHLKVNPSCSKYTHEETVRYPCILHARILMDTPMRSPFQILDHSMTIDCKEDVIKTHKCKIVCTKMAWSGHIITTPPPPTPLPSLPRHSPVPTVALWVKCFSQEHSTLTGPGLDPRCLDLQLSALMPLHLYRIMSNRPLCCFWWHVEADFHSHCVHLTIIIIIIIVNALLQISSSQLKSVSYRTTGAPFNKRFPSITGGALQYRKHPFYPSP